MIDRDIKSALDLQLIAGSLTVEEYRQRLREAHAATGVACGITAAPAISLAK